MVEGEKVRLISREGEEFKVDARIQNMSILLQHMLEDLDGDYSEPVPLPAVPSKQLRLVIQYCQMHNFGKAQTDLVFPLPSKTPSEFINDPNELAFIQQFNEDELIEMISATNFMHVPALFELCCAMIASDLKGKDFN
mmetsp:Transcript_24915/g.33378  ORF Transcript_24915/g.33378 Transcript_24915/m.33378 type:complete len:138 (+) Transcript_24915:41-454(+)|eukprot:CAMPEP_0170464356 /NCGR_PEP_ID=MMETSP0123-20130129/9121_1 /TAXON_ID=182087 /ORGANISM="Favella ehrenbergii, Strain Fehren 1" /LENGTH=137 /DNA_ID=CAMNT_0010730013 /DNA_START=59 /DNA_END=472 /DNA_ORIENTATION=+